MESDETEQSDIESIPICSFYQILEYLSPKDMINLAMTSRSMRSDIYDLKLDAMYRKCMDEIDEEFRGDRSDAVEQTAKHGHNKWDYECQYVKTSYGTKEAYMDWNIKCSVFPGRVHRCRISYIRNPRDLDLVAYYLDDQKIFSSMF